MIAFLLSCTRSEPPAEPVILDRGDNGVWLRRIWLHDDPLLAGREDALFAGLIEDTRRLGITRLYPFLGPMDADGHPGWRSDEGIRGYEPDRVKRFFDAMHAARPELKIHPWTGGILDRDVRFSDEERLARFVTHTAQIVALGADGIQLNVEPLPDGTTEYLDLLRAVKAAIGPDKTLSVAAYPPTTLLHPFSEVHWSLDYSRQVCEIADEVAVMAYDTGLGQRVLFRGLVEKWAADLAETLPPPSAGGCELLIGLPAYEDDEPWHRPDVETIDVALSGVIRAFPKVLPEHVRGVAVYASWTTDASEWRDYNRLWRGQDAPLAPMTDFGLTVP
ncbi:MAG: hypothetical protein ACI8RZ_005320 [Myxococcota bacterium]|jgi:hypothetical protein